jgi:hypothetical protein
MRHQGDHGLRFAIHAPNFTPPVCLRAMPLTMGNIAGIG